jgi:hypothetical protein
VLLLVVQLVRGLLPVPLAQARVLGWVLVQRRRP